MRATEHDFLGIAQFVESVAGKQDAVAGVKLHHVLRVSSIGKHAGGKSALAQLPARAPGNQQGERDTGVGEGEFSRGRVEDCV